MFYHYSQNNSGGSFDFNKEEGITHHVVIEADNAHDADSIAENIGLYFDGCAEGMDCECCGDRWCSAYGKGDDVPKVYDHILGENFKEKWVSKWMEDGYECVVHFKDGTKKWYAADYSFTEEN